MSMQAIILSMIGGYFLGAIPFGFLLTRAAGLGDIRDIGSGNIGATNVLRTGNRWLAGATFALDAAKGAIAVILARHFFGDEAGLIAGGMAFLGHLFPFWLQFKGGKGVSTYIGAMLALSWGVGLIFCAVWLFIAMTRRMSSLSALTAAATAPIFAFVLSDVKLAALAGAMSLLLMLKHASNIRRLIDGTEPRIGGEKT